MIDLSQELLDRNGIVMKAEERIIEDGEYPLNEYNKPKTEEVPLTVGRVISNDLLAMNGETQEETLKYFNLFNKVNGAKEIKPTKEELEMIKKAVFQNNTTYIAGTLLTLIK